MWLKNKKKRLIYPTTLILSFLTMLSCGLGDKEEEEEEDSTYVGAPTTGGGGMPSASQAIVPITEDEAAGAVFGLNSSIQNLSLDMDQDSSLSLNGEDGCQEGMFCLVTAFSQIFEMVTGAARCNFSLLSTNPDGSKKTPQKVDGQEIYYLDGLGTIGLGEQGKVECPDHEQVLDWGKAHKIFEGEPTLAHSEDEFYPPTRIVIYKTQDGQFKWNVIFFPKDLIQPLAERIPPLKGMIDKELDFVAYKGNHNPDEEVGKGQGIATLDFDELARMMQTLDALDESDEAGKDEGIPHGKIQIEYDMISEPAKFVTTFLDGFSFGDDDDSPFVIGEPTSVYKSSAGENYMHFISGDSFAEPDPDDPEDDGGPFAVVQYCNNPNFGQQNGGGPFEAVNYKDVPVESYLATPSETHLQVIWQTPADGSTSIDDYLVELTATQGGARIYGDIRFQIGKKSGTSSESIRLNSPKCDGLTDEKMTEINDFMKQYGGVDSNMFDDEGFINFSTNSEGGGSFMSKEDVVASFPDFSIFKLVPASGSESPIK